MANDPAGEFVEPLRIGVPDATAKDVEFRELSVESGTEASGAVAPLSRRLALGIL